MAVANIFKSLGLVFIIIIFPCVTSNAYGKELAPVNAFSIRPLLQGAAVSPNGDRIAFSTIIDGVPHIQIFMRNGTDLTPVKTTQIRPNRYRVAYMVDLNWANEDWLIFEIEFTDRKDGGGALSTGRIGALSKDGETLNDFGSTYGSYWGGEYGYSFRGRILSFLPDEPNHILYSAGPHGVVKINVLSGHETLERRSNSVTPFWLSDLQGRVRLGIRHRWKERDFNFTLYDVDSGSWGDEEDYPGISYDDEIVGFMQNPNELIILRYGDLGTKEAIIYDLKKKSFTRTLFSNDTYDAAGVVLDSRKERVIGISYLSNRPEIYYFDPKADIALKSLAQKYPGMTVSILSQSQAGDVIIANLSASNVPDTTVIYSQEMDKAAILSFDYPDLMDTPLSKTRTLTYAASDGFIIPAYLTLPIDHSSQSLPFIVLPHGGPYSRDYEGFDWLVQFLTSRGYGVLQMNFRGSDGYGKVHLEQGRNDWGLMLSDVNDGANWAISEGLAKEGEVCILGWSFGGYLALSAAAQSNTPFSCAASVNGVSDWTKVFVADTPEFWGNLVYATGKKKDVSPIYNVGDLGIPVFIAHGELDFVVPYTQHKAYKRKLRKASVKTSELSFPSSGHGVVNSQDREALLIGLENFFAINLKQADP